MKKWIKVSGQCSLIPICIQDVGVCNYVVPYGRVPYGLTLHQAVNISYICRVLCVCVCLCQLYVKHLQRQQRSTYRLGLLLCGTLTGLQKQTKPCKNWTYKSQDITNIIFLYLQISAAGRRRALVFGPLGFFLRKVPWKFLSKEAPVCSMKYRGVTPEGDIHCCKTVGGALTHAYMTVSHSRTHSLTYAPFFIRVHQSSFSKSITKLS